MKSPAFRVAAGLAVAVVGAGSARAAAGTNFVWDGAGADDNWSTPLNWVQQAAPTNDGTADVVMSGYARPTPNVDVPYAVDSLTFAPATGAFNIGGGTLTVGAGGLTNLSGSIQRVFDPITLSADQTWNAGNAAGGYVFSQGGVNTNGHAVTFTGGNSIILQGVVSGSGSLVTATTGGGLLVNYGTNTYTGGTVVNSGELYVTADAALGAAGAPVTINNGGVLTGFMTTTTVNRDVTLGAGGGVIGNSLPQYSTLTLAGPIHGPGSLTLNGSGAAYVNLTGHDTYAGGTVVNKVMLVGTTDSIQGNVTVTDVYAQLQLTQNFNGTYAGNVTGGGAVLKSGTGVVALTGNNTYSGGTAVTGGTLEVVAGTSELSPNGPVNLSNGGVLQYVGGGTFTRPVGNATGVGFGTAGGFAARGGRLTINFGGASAPVDFDPLTGGSASVGFGSPTADSVVEVQNPFTLGAYLTSPAPTIAVTAGVGGDYALFSGVLSGANSLVKTGTGTLVLGATNTFAGGLTITGGAVQANDGGGLPSSRPLVFQGGVLLSNGTASFTRPLGTYYGGQTVVNWSGSGGFAAAGGTLTVNLGGAGATQTWGATNFVPTGSALLLGAARASGQTLFVNPINLGTGVREIRVDGGLGGDFAVLAGGLAGAGGGVIKTGTGQLVLQGTSTYTAGTTVSAGSLVVAGALAGSGVTVSAGASLGGTGSVTGTVTVAGGGTLNLVDGTAGTLTVAAPAANAFAVAIGGAAGSPAALDFEVGAAADRLLVTSGYLTVNAGGGQVVVTPTAGLHAGTFDLIDFPAGQAIGLGQLSLATPGPAAGYTFGLRQTSTALQLVVAAVPEPTGIAAVVAAVALVGRRRRRSGATRPVPFGSLGFRV